MLSLENRNTSFHSHPMVQIPNIEIKNKQGFVKKNCAYHGQVDPEKLDKPDGIGMVIDGSGNIQEGFYKDGKCVL